MGVCSLIFISKPSVVLISDHVNQLKTRAKLLDIYIQSINPYHLNEFIWQELK